MVRLSIFGGSQRSNNKAFERFCKLVPAREPNRPPERRSLRLFGTVSERKFDRLRQETKNRLLLFLCADPFNFVTAQRAELEVFSATTTQTRNAIFAHDLLAMRAAVGHTC